MEIMPHFKNLKYVSLFITSVCVCDQSSEEGFVFLVAKVSCKCEQFSTGSGNAKALPFRRTMYFLTTEQSFQTPKSLFLKQHKCEILQWSITYKDKIIHFGALKVFNFCHFFANTLTDQSVYTMKISLGKAASANHIHSLD